MIEILRTDLSNIEIAPHEVMGILLVLVVLELGAVFAWLKWGVRNG